MYKLISSDLDETLLNSNHLLSAQNINAIKSLKNVKFVLNTGRSYMSIQPFLKELDLYDKENEYTISFNGAFITENKNNKVLYKSIFDYDLANKLYKLGKQYNVCIHIYTIDTIYIYNYWQEEKAFLSNRFNVLEIFDDDLSFFKDKSIIKLLYENEDYAILSHIAKENASFFNNFDISYSSNRYLEFNMLGVNKGTALLKLSNILKIDLKETIAIGDSLNDLSMIKTADLGIGVANCLEEIKTSCDYITQNDNNHHAIKEIIEIFVKEDL